MNILDEAARQNREIVTRDGRKPDWIHYLPKLTADSDGIVYGLNGGIEYANAYGAYTHMGPNVRDLILAPKKATIWYQTFGGKITTLTTRPPDPTESALWHFVDVSLP